MGRFGLYTFIKPTTNLLVEGAPAPQNVEHPTVERKLYKS